jgi:hypothetical protein
LPAAPVVAAGGQLAVSPLTPRTPLPPPTVRVEFAIPHDRDLLGPVLTHGVIANQPWEEPAIFVDEALVTASRMITGWAVLRA